MKRSQAFESVIETAAEVKGRLERLLAHYAAIKPVIENEHNAIRASDMAKVAICEEEKVKLTDLIESDFAGLREACQTLVSIRERFEGPNAPRITELTITEMLGLFVTLGSSLAENKFARQVLEHQVKGVRDLVQAFDKSVKIVQPLLEMNMYVVAEMLANMQRSYQFHMSLVAEDQAAYTGRGIKNAKSAPSGFKAKV